MTKLIAQEYYAHRRNTFALILLDYQMIGMSGIEVLEWIKEFFANNNVSNDLPKIAFCCDYLSDDAQRKLLNKGIAADDILEKPVT